ncbi:hypothetical protein HDU91_006141 [Kappamyces sp. JEL0680]|nr:hypothetical protein HDU91_006141 [Kappamyces sp. JEL0680]
MGKERNFNPAEAQRKADKKRQKLRNKEASKQHRANDVLLKDARRFEQEFLELLHKNAQSKNLNAILQTKLGQINNVRMELNEPTKTLADYEKVIRKAKKEAKQAAKAGPAKKPVADDSSSSSEGISDTEDRTGIDTDALEYQDLSHIKIPAGEAPETEGQIYKSLHQLQPIFCKAYKISKTISKKPPPPPPRSLPFGSLPFPHPAFGPVPGMAVPMPFFLPPGGQAVPAQASAIKQTAASSAAASHSRLYSKQSHAPPLQRHDPLAPEIEDALVKKPAAASSSSAVISAAPVMRNLQKELTGMVPRALQNKKK